jgi:hypothetical protein
MKVTAGVCSYESVMECEVCKSFGQIRRQREVVNIMKIECTHVLNLS